MFTLDSDDSPGLAQKALSRIRVFQGGRKKKLERDTLAELDMPRGNHCAHASYAENTLHDVLASDDLAGPRSALV
jgi:hypothetical protein